MLFIADVICIPMKNEIRWPDEEKRAALGRMKPGMAGCIGHIDGTFCRIPRPRIPDHKKYYNDRKKMCCRNSTVVIDKEGFFIFVDAGYAGSFHDIHCLRHSDLYTRWRRYFRNYEESVEYLLGDPGYMGAEMFILRKVDNRERNADGGNPVIDAFNRRHAAERVKVEWGIGGLKIDSAAFWPAVRIAESRLLLCSHAPLY